MSRSVVITGLGTTNPLGGDVASTWDAALAGRSGVRSFDNDWVERYGLPLSFAGFLAESPENTLERRQMRRLDPTGQYAMVAATQAWAQAGEPKVDPERLGVVLSSGIGGVWTILDAWDTIKEKGARRVMPLTVPMLMPNSPAANVSVMIGAKAGAHAPVSACASGAEAIGDAVRKLREGRADVIVAGGTEAAIHPMPLASFAKMQALSTRNDDPEGASRPYDADRDGFVLGEGAAALVLETEEHAKARGATILARIAGVGMTADAYDIAPPDPSGAGQENAMRLAIEDAGLTGSDICHVNAHATSTPVGDTIEAAAIRRVLAGDGDAEAVVTGTKSMTGHLLGGAGALESVFTVLALRERMVPPTINIENLDPDVRVDVAANEPRPLAGEGQLAAINNSFGFGGHNVALLFTTA